MARIHELKRLNKKKRYFSGIILEWLLLILIKTQTMKNFKLVVAVAGIAISTVVSAQDKTNTSKPLTTVESVDNEDDNHVEKFKDQLNLTPEQKAKIKEIRGKREIEKMELKLRLKELRVAERLEINSILTEEQQGLIKEKTEMKHKKFEGKRPVRKDKNKDGTK